MKKLQRIKAFLAIAAMFLMTTTVYAQHNAPGNIVFQIVGPGSGNLAFPATGAPLSSFTIGGPAEWAANHGLLFTSANEGSATPHQASPNINAPNAVLTGCSPAPTALGRIGQQTNLYTFRFTYTSVSELTLVFYAGINENAPLTGRSVTNVRTGTNRNALAVHPGFTTSGNFEVTGVNNTNFSCDNARVTVLNLNVPAGTYIEITTSHNAAFSEAIVRPMPTGEASLFIDSLVVGATVVLPEQTFSGLGPFEHALQHTDTETPGITVYALTPSGVNITATHGTGGPALTVTQGVEFATIPGIPMPAGVYSDTIVVRLTGTSAPVLGEYRDFLVIFQKDTVLPRVLTVMPEEGDIPAEGNIVVTFNKPMFATVDLDELVEINGEAVAVTLVGSVLTIPYTVTDWDGGDLKVEILPNLLVDAVLTPFEGQIFNFTQDMTVPTILALTVSGEDLDGATNLPTSFVVNLEFARPDVVRNPTVEITLGGEVIEVTGTSIALSNLDFSAEYTLNIPANAFMVATNDMLTSQAISATFETGVFRVILGAYRQIAGCNFRAFRHIVQNEETGVREWARGENAYSGDTVWFYTGTNAGTPEDPIWTFTPLSPNTANVPNTHALFNMMLSPNRFDDGAQMPCANVFEDTMRFAPSAKARPMHQVAMQFTFRLESTSVSEIALNLAHTGTRPEGYYVHISEIAFGEFQTGPAHLWTQADFVSDTVDVRGMDNIADYGPFIVTATGLEIPQGRFVRVRLSHSRMLVEAYITPIQEEPVQDYLIESVTYNNAEGNAIDGDQNAPLTFVASVNFERDDMVRNTAVNITLNGTAIEESTITGTTISFTNLAETTNFELVFPEGAFMSNANNALTSQAYTVNFRTTEGTSIFPEISAQAISIHPNPVSDVLYVTAENMQLIEIMDMLGRTVLKRTTTNNRESIDVTELREGLYFIRITKTNGEVAVMRFVKN